MEDHEQGVAGLRSVPRRISSAAQDGLTGNRGFLYRILRRLLAGLGDPPLQIVLWNGERVSSAAGGAPKIGRASCRERV